MNKKIHRKRRISVAAVVDVRAQLIDLQRQVVRTGLHTFRESSTAALDASQAQELQETRVRDNALLRAHLHNKHASQRDQMMAQLHAADQTLSHLLARANDGDDTEQVASRDAAEQHANAKIDEMHSLLAEHESHVNVIIDKSESVVEDSTDDLNETRGASCSETESHSSCARIAAAEMWRKRSEEIICANAFARVHVASPGDHGSSLTEDDPVSDFLVGLADDPRQRRSRLKTEAQGIFVRHLKSGCTSRELGWQLPARASCIEPLALSQACIAMILPDHPPGRVTGH